MNKQYAIYNQEYYKNYNTDEGIVPYTDANFWKEKFVAIAKNIVDNFHPKTVLDAGCAMGYLVAALRDLGVEAYGVDVSEYAISSVRDDIKPYCAVGSLSDSLPAELPQEYDLIVCIEVLEHLPEADGRQTIQNLCNYSKQVLFSSTPNDFEDVTHINVQQREYWAQIFAENQFYDVICDRPIWLTPYAVLYRESNDPMEAITQYERFVRQVDYAKGRSAHQTFEGRIYFNFGNGEDEAHCQKIHIQNGKLFQERINIPEKCSSVRFDPVEGLGCLVRDFRARSDSASLEIKECNGVRLKNILLFRTIDPQIVIDDLPSNTHWIEVEAEVLTFDSSSWINLCDYVLELLDSNVSKTLKIQEEKQENEELREALAEEQEKLLQLEQENEACKKEIQDYSNLVAYEREEAAKVQDALNAIRTSTIWVGTKPLRLIMNQLKRFLVRPICRAMRLVKKTFRCLHQTGLKVTIHKIKYRLTGKGEYIPVSIIQAPFPPMDRNLRSTITGHPTDPIQTLFMDESVKRLNLVTDSIGANSLLGGVATALIVATQFANQLDYELRIITRNADSNPLNYENIMKISGIQPAKKVSFYSDYARFTKAIDFKMEISSSDIFFATSWWSAVAISQTTIRKRFFYIIQEVETFFYNYGGERMLCEQVMHNPNIDFIVNSSYLHQYFAKYEPNIVENGCYFEPAFPEELYSKKIFMEKKRYKLFFYARPNNPRNLYEVGVEFLKKAVEQGIVDTNQWDIYCVGQNAPAISFANGAQTINLGQLSWTEYAKFLSDVDLGLCLMYTPHPSYPPFDVACSGGVVLTNKMLNKTSFDMCKNVILSDLEEESFMNSFREAVALAQDIQQRRKNYEENTIPRNWAKSLESTVMFMRERCDNV